MEWTDLDTFTTEYLVAALWSSMDWDDKDEAGNPEHLDAKHGLSDIAEVTLIQAKADCDQFRALAGDLLWEWTDEQAGHDFWLTRCHHGAGFWDRGKGATGDALTKLCEQFRNLDPVVGDDGKIYFE